VSGRPPIPKLQFRILYREFLFRVVDLELLSPQGDMSRLLGQFATILLLISLWMSVPVLGILNGSGPPLLRVITIWAVEHFLIATTMLVVGIFAVLSWDSLFPDRRDVLVLAPLPIQARTLFLSKVTAVATVLSLTVLLLNAFTGISAPFGIAANPVPAYAGSGPVIRAIRSLAAYWSTMLAAGTFVFCGVLSLQGAAQLLPRQRFLRVSSFLQIACFGLFLLVYFLQPGFTDLAQLISPRAQRLLPWLPSYWFFALFQTLNGTPAPELLDPLARRAWIGLAAAVCGAAASYAICYFRTLRKIAEEPDILPVSRRQVWLPRFGNGLTNAVVRFSIRTLVRSRQHRVIFAFYLGISFGFLMFLIKAPVLQRQLSAADPWHQVNAPLLVASILTMCSAVMGIRVVFSMPLDLPANWTFRIAPIRGGADCLSAARRSLFVLGVIPVSVAAAAVLLWLWPWRPALAHLAILGLLGTELAEISLHSFPKIPFTCSYLPGKSYAHMAILGYLGLLFLITKGADLERAALVDNPADVAAIVATFGIAAALARWRTSALAASPDSALQFQELPQPAIFALKVHPDGPP
jgi:hypothetical protein